MDPRLQAKLLRAIQEREIDRVGGTQPIRINIRLLATSNRDLEEEVRKGNFRDDLYFRLNVVNIALPPLRERPNDIEVLSEHFTRKYAEANGVPTPRITPQALQMLRDHHWRGNVRELENAMHRAILLSENDEITPAAIMLTGSRLIAAAGADGMALDEADEITAGAESVRGLVGRTVADVERDLIIDTLEHCLGNRTHAANILGISIRTLRNKLKLYSEEGIPIPGPRDADRASA
jgi:DNA-binding NtrC family response regulator